MIRQGLKFGFGLGVAYVINVQILTWLGLGLTSWVFAMELVLLAITVFLLEMRDRRHPGESRTAAGVVGRMLALVLATTFINALYLVIYINIINPDWVDMVVTLRGDLLRAGGMPEEQIADRMVQMRGAFRPLSMLTMGLLFPALWKSVIGLLLTRPARWVGRSLVPAGRHPQA